MGISAYEFDISLVSKDKGFCYVVFFSNGVAKAGKTTNLLARTKKHESDAHKFGNSIDSILFTEQINDFDQIEVRMLSALKKIATSNRGEYLHGISKSACTEALNGTGIFMHEAVSKKVLPNSYRGGGIANVSR